MHTESAASNHVYTASGSERSASVTQPRVSTSTAIPVALALHPVPAPIKPAPPPNWSRSIFGAAITVCLFFLLFGGALLVCALPPLFIASETGRKIYVAAIVPMTAVLGTVMCCYTFVAPYTRSNRFLVKSATEFSRHREFLVSSRAHARRMALFSGTTDDSFYPSQAPVHHDGEDDDNGQSRYYHRSPAAQQHADTLDIKREMLWTRRQLEYLLADRSMRSGNPTMSVQQRSLQLFLFSFMDLQQEMMTLLQETITHLKEAHQASSMRALTINTARSAPRTPAPATPRDAVLSPVFAQREAPDSPALQTVLIDEPGTVVSSSPADSSFARSLPRHVAEASAGDTVEDLIGASLPDTEPRPAPPPRASHAASLLMPRFSPLLSAIHLPLLGKPSSTAVVMSDAEKQRELQEEADRLHTAQHVVRPLDVIAKSAVPHTSGPPSATPDRDVDAPAMLSVPQEGATPSAALAGTPRPIPRPRPAQPCITLRRGARCPTDGGFVFLEVVSRTRTAFLKREVTLLFEAVVNPPGAALGETHLFAPHEGTGLPLKGYALIGGRRTSLSIAEVRRLGFVTCDIEKISLDDTASPSVSVSSRLSTSSEEGGEGSLQAHQSDGSSALLNSTDGYSPHRRSPACQCPVFTAEESFIVSWSPLPGVPMRLTFLTVDFEDTSTQPPTPTRKVAVPVLECLIQDVLCVVTKITADMRGAEVSAVTLEGISLEDPASRVPSSTSSSTAGSPNKRHQTEGLALSVTNQFDSKDFSPSAASPAEPAFIVGAVVTQTIDLSQAATTP